MCSRVSRRVWEPVPVCWAHTHTCPWLLPAPLAAGTLRPAVGVPVMGTGYVRCPEGITTVAPRTSQACGVGGEKAGQGLGPGVAVWEDLSVQGRTGGPLAGSGAPRQDWGGQQTGTGQRGAGLQGWTEAREAWAGCSRGLGCRQELGGHRTSTVHIYWTSGASPERGPLRPTQSLSLGGKLSSHCTGEDDHRPTVTARLGTACSAPHPDP